MLNLLSHLDHPQRRKWQCHSQSEARILNATNRGGPNRRGFLQLGALAGLGLSLPQLLAQQASGARKRETNCILIWTRGGTSHHDTFDPKPDAPVSVRGEFGVIDTATPGVKFTEILPNLAREQKRFALLR
ncbi:MAG: DUF1501 domain-containing protein, partial [Pirellulaceae bacterium]|nr:DUF1501 domain-containing protein [Pirellulaceae bacterium]